MSHLFQVLRAKKKSVTFLKKTLSILAILTTFCQTPKAETLVFFLPFKEPMLKIYGTWKLQEILTRNFCQLQTSSIQGSFTKLGF